VVASLDKRWNTIYPSLVLLYKKLLALNLEIIENDLARRGYKESGLMLTKSY